MQLLDALRLAANITENENEIRKYILAHPGIVMNMSITDLAKKTYTSPAAITRFCHKIGTGGFSQLKLMLAAELSRADIATSEVEQISKNQASGNPMQDIMDRVTRSTIFAIEDTAKIADPAVYQKAAELIDKAPAIDFYGNGTSNLVVQDAAYKFMRIGKTVSYFDIADKQKVQAMITPKDHIAMIISYSGENGNVLEIASILKSRNIKIIAITTQNNSLNKYADYVLSVSMTEPVMRKVSMSSRIAQFYVVDILFNLCFSMHYDEYIETTRDTIVL